MYIFRGNGGASLPFAPLVPLFGPVSSTIWPSHLGKIRVRSPRRLPKRGCAIICHCAGSNLDEKCPIWPDLWRYSTLSLFGFQQRGRHSELKRSRSGEKSRQFEVFVALFGPLILGKWQLWPRFGVFLSVLRAGLSWQKGPKKGPLSAVLDSLSGQKPRKIKVL